MSSESEKLNNLDIDLGTKLSSSDSYESSNLDAETSD